MKARVCRLRRIDYHHIGLLTGNGFLRFCSFLATILFSTLDDFPGSDAAPYVSKLNPKSRPGVAGFLSSFAGIAVKLRESALAIRSFPHFLWFVLLCLPFLQSTRWTSLWSDAFFSAVYILCVITLECFGHGSHWMLGYVCTTLLIRIFMYKHVWNCLAVAVSYLIAFRRNLEYNNHNRNRTSSVSLSFIGQVAFVAIFFYSVLSEKVYRRLCNRLWDHIHILLVLREKAKRCHRAIANIASAHLSPIMVEHIFPHKQTGKFIIENNSFSAAGEDGSPFFFRPPLDKQPSLSSLDLSRQSSSSRQQSFSSSQKSSQSSLLTPPSKLPTATASNLIDAILKTEVIYDATDGTGSSWPYKEICALEGLDKRFCTLIAIRICPRTKSELISEHERFALNAVISEIALERKVAHIRNFGSMWIGSAGFFENSRGSEKGPRTQALVWESLMMALEVQMVLKNMKRDVIVAIDANEVIGGFTRNSPNFSFFGSESRWVISVAQEFPQDKSRNSLLKVPLSAKVRDLLLAKEKAAGNDPLEFTLRRFSSAWSNHASFQTTIRAYTLNYLGGMQFPHLSEEKLEEFADIYAGNIHNPIHIQLANDYKYLLFEYKSQSRTHSDIDAEETPPLDGHVDDDDDDDDDDDEQILKILTEWSYENVPAEFLEHCDVKYDGILEDPIMETFSDEEIMQMHRSMLEDVTKLIKKHCFKSYLHYFFLVKPEDWTGWNEWKPNNVNALMSKPLKEKCGPAGPLEVMHAILPNPLIYFQTWAALLRSLQSSPLPQPPPGKIKPPASFAGRAAQSALRRGHRECKKVVPVNLAVFDWNLAEDDEVGLRGKVKLTTANRSSSATLSCDFDAQAASPQSKVKPTPVGQSGNETNALSPHGFGPGLSQCWLSSSSLTQNSTKSQLRWNFNNFNNFRKDIMIISSSPGLTVLSHTILIIACIYTFCTIPLVFDDRIRIRDNDNTGAYGFLWGLILGVITFERRIDGIHYLVRFTFFLLILLKIPRSHFQCQMVVGEVTELSDFNGESLIFVSCLTAVFLADVRTPIYVVYSYYFAGLLVFAGSRSILGDELSNNCETNDVIKANGGKLRLILFSVFLLAFQTVRWLLEYAVYVLFIINSRVTPESLRRLQADVDKARCMLVHLEPAFQHQHYDTLVDPCIYPNCTVITINFKASAFMAGILEKKPYEAFYNQVSSIIHKTLTEWGLLKVTEFSGLITIVDSKDLFDSSLHSVNSIKSYKEATRTAFFLTTLQQRVDDFAVMNKFNVELGIGVDRGPAMVGLLGGRTHCLDVTGYARDFSQVVSSLFSAESGKAQFILTRSFAVDTMSMEHFKSRFVLRPASLLYRKARHSIQIVEQAFTGMTLDDFDLIAMLGRGGYGSVHLVREISTAKLYAVKVIPQKKSFIDNVADQEFRALQRLHFPNVVSFKHCLMNEGRVYLFMSYVEGGTLQQVVEKYEPPVSHLMFWFAELVLAIEYVHSVGIIHRDVKPANCMIGTDGHLRLCDFGLSKSIDLAGEASGMEARMASSKNEALDADTLKMLEMLMPVKSRLQEDFTESSYNILLTPLLAKQGGRRHEESCCESQKTLLDMYFSVTLAASFDDAKAKLASKCKAEVVIIELVSASETISGDVELLEALTSCLLEINNPGSLFSDIPIMILSAPNFLDEKLQQSLKRQFLPVKHFLSSPLGFNDRASLMYFGRVARNSTSEFIEMLHEARATNMMSPGSANTADLSTNLQRHKDIKAGTAHFMAPEIILRGEYSKAVDWWACGISMYFCTIRSQLIDSTVVAEVLRRACHDTMDVHALHAHSPPLEELVQGLLCRNVPDRLGTAGSWQIRQHPFFKQINWTTFQMVPPFKPGAELQARVKNAAMFYGNYRPAHQPALQPVGFTPDSVPCVAPAASARSKKSVKHNLRQQLERFGSLAKAREVWIRQGAVNDNRKTSSKHQQDLSKDWRASTSMGMHNTGTLDASFFSIKEESSLDQDDSGGQQPSVTHTLSAALPHIDSVPGAHVSASTPESC